MGRPGSRDRQLVVLAILIGCALVACSSSGQGTPGPSSGAAFEAVSVDQTQCGRDTCVSFDAKNIGTIGPGRCELLGTTRDSSGVESSVPGPSVQLPAIDRGKVWSAMLRWTGAVPNGGLRVLCEPGLRS